MSSFAGWDLTGWATAIVAVITACGLIWNKVVKPIRNWLQAFKAWMIRIEAATVWTETQMKPNGGSTLVDKVDKLQKQVTLLLKHDAERDTAGKRYGDIEQPTEDTP